MSALQPRRGRVVGLEAAPQVLGGLLAVAVWLRLTILKLAVVASVSAAVIAYALLRHGFSGEPGPGLLTVLGLGLAVAPPLLLLTLRPAKARPRCRMPSLPLPLRQPGRPARCLRTPVCSPTTRKKIKPI